MKYIKLLLVMTFFISGWSYASCYTNQGGAYPVSSSLTLPDIIVQRDLPVGGVIGSYSFYFNSDLREFSCTAGGGYYSEMSLFTTSSGISHVYKTNVPGVGVSVSNASMSTFFESPALFSSNGPSQAIGFTSRTLTLIKTGPVTSGVMSSGLLARAYGDGDRVTALSMYLTGSTITQVACSINTPNLTFPIGDILASAFGSTVGTTPSVAQNTQNLSLTCDPQANINVSLSGTQNPDVGTTSVLALSGQGSAGVAKGVGVQIVYNGSPLSLNTQVVLKRSAGGQELLPFTARYYQTKTSVATGTANASATLNLIYQ